MHSCPVTADPILFITIISSLVCTSTFLYPVTKKRFSLSDNDNIEGYQEEMFLFRDTNDSLEMNLTSTARYCSGCAVWRARPGVPVVAHCCPTAGTRPYCGNCRQGCGGTWAKFRLYCLTTCRHLASSNSQLGDSQFCLDRTWIYWRNSYK